MLQAQTYLTGEWEAGPIFCVETTAVTIVEAPASFQPASFSKASYFLFRIQLSRSTPVKCLRMLASFQGVAPLRAHWPSPNLT